MKLNWTIRGHQEPYAQAERGSCAITRDERLGGFRWTVNVFTVHGTVKAEGYQHDSGQAERMAEAAYAALSAVADGDPDQLRRLADHLETLATPVEPEAIAAAA